MKSPHLLVSQFFTYYANLLEALVEANSVPTEIENLVRAFAAPESITDLVRLQDLLALLRRGVWTYRNDSDVRRGLDLLIMALQALEELLRSKAMLGKVEKT